jgi:hypothetical protein
VVNLQHSTQIGLPISFHFLTRHGDLDILDFSGQSGCGIMAKNLRQSIFRAAVLISAMAPICFFATKLAGAAPIWAVARPAQAIEYPFYVEFRVAVDGVYGHSYIAYGRLDVFGRPATATYADIHPTGDLPSMVLGHFLPMEAATVPEKDTLGYKIARRFRKPLTAAEYSKLKLVITHIRAVRHSWSVVAYNCNDFVADVARGMGMQTPATLSLPYDFIPRLQAINQRTFRATSLNSQWGQSGSKFSRDSAKHGTGFTNVES